MANFDTGISRYVHATATVDVWFPVDHKGNEDVCCAQCPFFNASFRSCSLNDKLCAYPSKYVGADCPLVLKEGEEENLDTSETE